MLFLDKDLGFAGICCSILRFRDNVATYLAEYIYFKHSVSSVKIIIFQISIHSTLSKGNFTPLKAKIGCRRRAPSFL